MPVCSEAIGQAQRAATYREDDRLLEISAGSRSLVGRRVGIYEYPGLPLRPRTVVSLPPQVGQSRDPFHGSRFGRTASWRLEQTLEARRSGRGRHIRQDLADAGLLDAKFAAVPGLLNSVKVMGGRPAWEHVDKNWPKYQKIIQDSLTLKPFKGQLASVGKGRRITFRMASPTVMLIVLENSKD